MDGTPVCVDAAAGTPVLAGEEGPDGIGVQLVGVGDAAAFKEGQEYGKLLAVEADGASGALGDGKIGQEVVEGDLERIGNPRCLALACHGFPPLCLRIRYVVSDAMADPAPRR